MARLLDQIDAISMGRKNRVIFDHCSKRHYSFEGHSEPPFVRCFLIRQEISKVSWIAATFHGIRPPFVAGLHAMPPQTFLLALCARVSQQSHLFPDLCGVDAQ